MTEMPPEISAIPPGVASVSSRTTGQRPAAGGEALRGLCEEFEALFIKQILETAGVGRALEDTGLGMTGIDVCGELARALSEKGCLGIAEALCERLSDHPPGGET